MKLTTKPVWEPITIAKALSLCDFDALYVAMNLAFACSLRIGEILGLTWDDIYLAENGMISTLLKTTMAHPGSMSPKHFWKCPGSQSQLRKAEIF